MTTTASTQRWRRLVSSLLHHPLLLVHSLIRWSQLLLAAPTEQGPPSLPSSGLLTTTTSEQSWGPRGSTSALLTLEFQLSRIRNDLPLPPCPGPGSQITQHARVPCQFGSTNVYFQRNLSRPLLVHVPHNSSPAVCAMLREAV